MSLRDFEKDRSYETERFSITEVLGKMAEEGKAVYGYEIKGDWLECGNKLLWIQIFFDSGFGSSRIWSEGERIY
jgi:UTP-glucose-1-phosphate uridylyltransferase